MTDHLHHRAASPTRHSAIKFTGELRVRCTPALAQAVEAAARARGVRLSDWLRGAAETSLCLDGLEGALTAKPEPHI
jgi:predicted HicB family RNase H-like nuclease